MPKEDESDEGFLDTINEEEAQVTPEPVIEEVVEEVVEEAVEAASEPEPEPKPEAKPEPQTAPISALLDERDKRKALEAELAQFRSQQQQPQAEVPDEYEDPEGYKAHQEQVLDERMYQQSLKMSKRFAVLSHGEELTNEALQWATARCDADAYFNAAVRASDDPIGFAVTQYQRDKIASNVTPTDFEQFQAWKAAQAGLTAETPPEAAPSKTMPPKSLASAPSAGSVMTEVAQTDEEIFEDTFSRK